MIDDVYLLIKSMTNYTVPDEDKDVVQYLWKATETDLKTLTNQAELPEELDTVHTRMTAGQYIRCRLQQIAGDDGSRVVNSITEGKVTVQLGGTTTAERLEGLAAQLEQPDKELIACCRKLRW